MMTRTALFLVSSLLLVAVAACSDEVKDPGWVVGEPSTGWSPIEDEPPRPTVSAQPIAPISTDAAAGGLVGWFSDGQFAVGTYVLPGTYQATPEWYGCYWEIASDFSGRAEAIRENGQGAAGVVVTMRLRDTDEVVKSRGCGTWRRIEESTP